MNQLPEAHPVVLVGGWGVEADMLAPLLEGWQGPVHLITLTDDLMDRCHSPDEVADLLLQQYPQPALWVGWSLGAQVVMAAARKGHPAVRAVVTITGFPRFVASEPWPSGMPQGQFDGFVEGIAQHPQRFWKRFALLLIQNDADEIQARNDLRPWLDMESPLTPRNLAKGLEWLRAGDQRRLWQTLDLPALHLLGDRDTVVRQWSPGFSVASLSRVAVIEGMAHWPRGPSMEVCRQHIFQFISRVRRQAQWAS